MRITEILTESANVFSQIMTHETSPAAADTIRQQGFKQPQFGQGIFFNVSGTSYSGGGYGGSEISAQISGPAAGILDLEDDDNLPEDLDEFADGDEIADYARSHGYWAWTDGVQMAVLDTRHIKVL